MDCAVIRVRGAAEGGGGDESVGEDKVREDIKGEEMHVGMWRVVKVSLRCGPGLPTSLNLRIACKAHAVAEGESAVEWTGRRG